MKTYLMYVYCMFIQHRKYLDDLTIIYYYYYEVQLSVLDEYTVCKRINAFQHVFNLTM